MDLVVDCILHCFGYHTCLHYIKLYIHFVIYLFTKNKQVAERFTVYWPAENSEVFGGFNGFVHCEGFTLDEDGGDITKIDLALVIPIGMYLSMQKAYLNKKLDYCDRYGHYCGVFMDVECEAVDDFGTVTLDTDYDDDGNPTTHKELPMVRVKSFSKEIDAEHG